MGRLMNTNIKLITIITILGIFTSIYSQISISKNEWFSQPLQYKKYQMIFRQNLPNASSDTNYWDFSDLDLTEDTSFYYVDTATPNPLELGEYINHNEINLSIADGGPGEHYFHNLGDTLFPIGRISTRNDSITTGFYYITGLASQIFPINYGNVHSDTILNTIFFEQDLTKPSLFFLVYQNTEIDAWGKLKLKCGEFDVVRKRSIGYRSVWQNDSTDTTKSTYLLYEWIAKDLGVIASIGGEVTQDAWGITDTTLTDSTESLFGEVVYKIGNYTTKTESIKKKNGNNSLIKVSPNPFNPITNLEFKLVKNKFVNITIYDSNGKKVETIVNREYAAGNNIISWNGIGKPSGIYFFKISIGNKQYTKKALLLK